MFEIVWSDNAANNLRKLPRNISKRVYKKVDELKENPYSNAKKLAGTSFYRVRVGDYRVIFTIIKDKLAILILNVKHRKKVYKK
ncbi:type II toxin-antitoxin system RelE/ParE family toxin [archaeon CG10_big_fil_rev_8_21_14_0_10_43_11]|nr:MAG: type II toxin-antitoxin system RelE/ParE family toxin [archaeon CG10_big_fil_rev_8_21_14_0_10_43_11]